jgi:uncharacterized RDD family membrane protein YckC
MKHQRSSILFALLLAVALGLGSVLRAQETSPASPPPAAPSTEKKADDTAVAPPEKKAEPAVAPAEATKSTEPAATAKPEESGAKTDEDKESAADEEKPAATAEATSPKTDDQAAKTAEPASQPEKKSHSKKDRGLVSIGGGTHDRDRVRIMDDVEVPAGETVKGDAVAVMGSVTVDGEVMHDAVAVMGDNTINGTVHHDVVAVMGDMTLGPKAKVDGSVVCVGGEIHRDPGAVVGGEVRVQPIGGHAFEGISNWWGQGLKHGRPLAIGAHLGWLWIVTAFSIAFYALLALIFPEKIRNCGDKLILEPGLAILAGVLGILALPVLFVLLCITIIGIPVALLVLPAGTLLVAMFGKGAIYGLVGRRLTGDRYHLAVAVMLGAGLFVVLYLVPILGLVLSLLVWFCGFGCAVLSIFGRAPKPAAVVAAAPTVPPAMPAASTAAMVAAVPPVIAGEPPIVGAAPAEAMPTAASPVVPNPIPVAIPTPVSMPVSPAGVAFSTDVSLRAGFWIRLGAAFLDFLLIGIGSVILSNVILNHEPNGPGLMFVSVVAYHAIMWKLKGATIGGVICGLRVVRLDNRPIDWGVSIVRALTAFLSFMVAGLGFIWVAFDTEKQSWHDKVAGTVIVKVPKGTALL